MEEVFKFFKIIAKLKLLPRTGWLQQGIKNPETVGSHTFGAAMLAWWLAKKEKLNPEKVVKLVLVHDLIEAITGDITPSDFRYQGKRDFEKKFIKELGQSIPVEIRAEITDLVEEYLEGKTAESRLASQAEKLETILQAYEYQKKLKRKIAKEFFNFYKNKISAKTGKEILEWLEIRL